MSMYVSMAWDVLEPYCRFRGLGSSRKKTQNLNISGLSYKNNCEHLEKTNLENK